MSRVRNRSWINEVRGQHSNIQRNYTSGAVLVNQLSTWNSPFTATVSTMTDEVTPGYFKSRRTNSHLPVNAMTRSGRKSFSSGECSWTFKNTYTPTGVVQHESACSGQLSNVLGANCAPALPTYSNTKSWQGDPALPAVPDDSNILIEALANANSNSWDLGTFLAEFNKTVSMINRFKGNVLNRADNIVSQMAKRKKNTYRTANAALTAFSESWLEYRYGWRTLAFDLQDIHESLQRLASLKSKPKRGSSYTENQDTYSISMPDRGLYNNPGTIPSMGATLCAFEATYSQIRTKAAHGSVMLEAVANEFAFIDPLTTAWEIVPFSFIVDWFVNIGDLIKAFSPFLSGNVLHGSLAHWDRIVETSTYSPSEYILNNYYPTIYDNVHQITGEPVSRTVITETYDRSASSPSFSLHLKFNVDIKKVVDLSTLFQLANAKRINGLLKLIRA
jgi:hypothetical protein